MNLNQFLVPVLSIRGFVADGYAFLCDLVEAGHDPKAKDIKVRVMEDFVQFEASSVGISRVSYLVVRMSKQFSLLELIQQTEDGLDRFFKYLLRLGREYGHLEFLWIRAVSSRNALVSIVQGVWRDLFLAPALKIVNNLSVVPAILGGVAARACDKVVASHPRVAAFLARLNASRPRDNQRVPKAVPPVRQEKIAPRVPEVMAQLKQSATTVGHETGNFLKPPRRHKRPLGFALRNFPRAVTL